MPSMTLVTRLEPAMHVCRKACPPHHHHHHHQDAFWAGTQPTLLQNISSLSLTTSAQHRSSHPCPSPNASPAPAPDGPTAPFDFAFAEEDETVVALRTGGGAKAVWFRRGGGGGRVMAEVDEDPDPVLMRMPGIGWSRAFGEL